VLAGGKLSGQRGTSQKETLICPIQCKYSASGQEEMKERG